MDDALHRILIEQYRRYPRLQIEDLYKLLHQASMGSEHALADEGDARAWLERELAAMGAGPEEPLIDEISPSGEIVRVHLRPYVALGHDPERLLEAFLQTAHTCRGSRERLLRYGEAAGRLASLRRLPVRAAQVGAYLRSMEQQGFPAVHHSQIYQELYRPAYRVVARALLKRLRRP